MLHWLFSETSVSVSLTTYQMFTICQTILHVNYHVIVFSEPPCENTFYDSSAKKLGFQLPHPKYKVHTFNLCTMWTFIYLLIRCWLGTFMSGLVCQLLKKKKKKFKHPLKFNLTKASLLEILLLGILNKVHLWLLKPLQLKLYFEGVLSMRLKELHGYTEVYLYWLSVEDYVMYIKTWCSGISWAKVLFRRT